MKASQRAFLAAAFGGPDTYEGPSLAAAHAHLVETGLDDSHFDAVAGHLKETLDELEVPADLAGEVMTIVAATRDEVLGRTASAAETAGKPAEADPTVAAKSDGGAPAGATKDGAGPRKDIGADEPAVAKHTIRVGVDLLEHLMTMVGELVLTRNQLLQMVRKLEDSAFAVPLQRLSHITTELQEGVMKTRMQPIGNAWSKLPRIVRDLAVELGKKVEFTAVGAETELDRQVLELIKDPLTHMVRNAVGHGIETPAERVKAGKPEKGTIALNAYHEGGHIIIEVSDDGRGLPVDAIKETVVASGLATEAELAAMGDQQIQQFIFKPGFSTAGLVTSVSGRGVGMDVVKTNIEKIGGTIELKSVAGEGAAITIKIPLTLAIVSALIVECCSERFAIPQISVVELVRAAPGSDHAIETISDTPVLRLRDRLLPLVALARALQLAEGDGEALARDGEAFIVVLQVGTFSFGIIVDKVFDIEEIVVKPVAAMLRDISMFSGNTILGDGNVVMILDPNGIAAAVGDIEIADTETREAKKVQAMQSEETVALLVFRSGDNDLKTVPLALVARLEEIDRASIEYSDARPVVQYRGQLMPLIRMDGERTFEQEGRQPVIVFSDQGRTMGLAVNEIIDIVDERLDIELTAEQPGLVGTAVIAGKATDVIDTGYYLTQAFRDWFKREGADGYGGDGKAKRVLLVEDSPFFRHLLTPVLSVAGYEVTTAENGDAALRLMGEGRDFDIIVSDIEMPGMDGFTFAKACKSDERWRSTPIVALSSYTSAKDLERGREAGFADYVGKFDRDTLLQTMSQSLAVAGGEG